MEARRIRFCEAADGIRVAYTVFGSGPPLVFVPRWATALEFRELPDATALPDGLARERTIITFDRRGVGASQREIDEVSLEAGLADLEAAVRVAAPERFDLLGDLDGCHIAALYAVRNPGKVRRLVLLGLSRKLAAVFDPEAIAGLAKLADESWQLARISMAGWALRGGPGDHLNWLVDMFDRVMSPEVAKKYMTWTTALDATEALQAIPCSTLVLHWRDDMQVGLEEARSAARYIPSSRFVIAEGPDPPWRGTEAIIGPILRFLAEADEAEGVGGLTGREVEVLSHIVAGCSNLEIARALTISESTAARHVRNIYEKIDVHNRAEATAWALRNGINPPIHRANT
jgi:pimeloyl-ACP methyl ester carboxylesterase/DNA-binding CsgD family transcriptional regulator